MYNLVLIAAGLAFLGSSIAFLVSNSKHRDIVLSRLNFRGRKASGSYTPPRSLSPKKQGLPSSDTQPSAPDYSNVFPPSRRHTLTDLLPGALNGEGSPAKELGQKVVDYSKRVPCTEVANAEPLRDHVTATGFTIEEIKRLGDFPDYATLSGVPLPSAYTNFDIKTAQPRPYRPLRWAYHQTMCRRRHLPIHHVG